MNQLFVGAVSSGVPVGLIVTLVLIAAAAIAIAVAVYKIKHGIRQISRNMFGTDSFVQGINNQKREMSETPRSLQAMTSLCLREYKEISRSLTMTITNKSQKPYCAVI